MTQASLNREGHTQRETTGEPRIKQARALSDISVSFFLCSVRVVWSRNSTLLHLLRSKQERGSNQLLLLLVVGLSGKRRGTSGYALGPVKHVREFPCSAVQFHGVVVNSTRWELEHKRTVCPR